MQSHVPGVRETSPLRRIVYLAVAVLALGPILAGCSLFGSTSKSLPTAELGDTRDALSTREVLTGAIRDLTPTASIGPGVVTPTPQPSRAPQVEPSPTSDQPLLTIDVPEPGQSIYSPVYVRGSGMVPFERTLEVQVLSVDGEILGRGPILFDPLPAFGEEAVYEGTLPFHQPGQQQLGSVRVLLRSPRDNSIVDYAQVLVVLLSIGTGPADITIDAPVAGMVVGNPVRVEGIALAPQNQVTVRLKSGPAVLASETVPLAGEIGQAGRFSVDLHYAPLPASASSQPGYPAPSEDVKGSIEVFFRSPKDGRIAQIAAVPVVIPRAVTSSQ